MVQPYQQLARGVKFLPCVFALLFALVGLSTAPPNIHAASLSSLNSALSFNWAGVEADGQRGSYNRAQMSFTVPSFKSKGEITIWAGLGGGLGGRAGNVGKNFVLVQAGVDSCLGSCPSLGSNCPDPNSQCNVLWWEIAATLAEEPIQFNQPVRAGDLISVSVASNVNNNGTDQFILKDLTAQPSESHTILVTQQRATQDGQPIPNILSSQGSKLSSLKGVKIPTDGASAECIVERPSVVRSIGNASLASLPKFSSINVSQCDTGLKNKSTLQAISTASVVKQITMTAGQTSTVPRVITDNIQKDSFTLSRA